MNEKSVKNTEGSVRGRIIKDSGQFLAGSLISRAISMIRPFVLLPLLTPSQLGIWNLMGVIIGYGVNAHLGILHGMNKAIPFFRGEGKFEEVEVMKDSCFWLNLFLGILAGGMLWIISWMVSPCYRSALRIISIAVFLQMIFTYFFCLLRADNRFDLVSRGFVVSSVSSATLVVFLAFIFDNSLLGALLGLSGGFLTVLFYWFFKGEYFFPFRLNRRSIKMALRMGLPLIILGFLYMLFMSIDRWVIVAKLGEAALGYYTLGIMASSLLGMAPAAVENVLYPRMLERFGSAAQDPCAAQNLLTMPLQVISGLMVILISGATLILPLIIRLLLPKYMPSIEVMNILIPAAFFLSIAGFGGVYMIAIDKQRFLMLVTIIAALVTLSVDFILLSAGYGLKGVAIGTTAGYVTYGLGYVVMAIYFAFRSRLDAIRFLAQILIPYFAMIIGLAGGYVIFPDGLTNIESLLVTVWRLVLVLSLTLIALWLTNRDGQILAILRAELQSWIADRKGRVRKAILVKKKGVYEER